MINLGDPEQAEEGTLLRMLDAAFSKDKDFVKNKLPGMLRQEYSIDDEVFVEEVGHMNAFLLRQYREGREDGREEMRAEMETTGKIINILLDLGRIDEVRRVNVDASLRSKLIAEFGL